MGPPPSPLWSSGAITDPAAWAASMKQLLELERREEKAELDEMLSALSPPEAQSAGLSLINLRVHDRSLALFGRTKYTLGKPRPKRGRGGDGGEGGGDGGGGGDNSSGGSTGARSGGRGSDSDEFALLLSCHRFRVGSEVKLLPQQGNNHGLGTALSNPAAARPVREVSVGFDDAAELCGYLPLGRCTW